MDWERIALWALSLVSMLGGFLLREVWGAVKALRQDLAALEVKISEEYVKVSAFDKTADRILNAIDDLRREISHKEDRK
jgi:hypothetical protein